MKGLTVGSLIVCALVCGCLGTRVPWGGLRARDDAFHEAVEDDDFATVKRFLDSGKKPDAPGLNPNAGTALYGCLSFKDFKMADLLASYGADVNRTFMGRSLAFHMVEEDNIEAYRWLLRHGAKPNADTLALLKSR